MTKPSGEFLIMMQEELQEYADALAAGDTHGMIDAIADLAVLVTNEVELNGYDYDLTMKQTVKHISARVQDPEQERDWTINGPSGKWKKWKLQPADTLIEPDYTVCRLSKASS